MSGRFFDAGIAWRVGRRENHPWLAAATCPIFWLLGC